MPIHKKIAKFIKTKIINKFLKKKILDKVVHYAKQIKPRNNAPPKIRKWIKNNSNRQIKKIVVCRKPINAVFRKLSNIITLGKFDKSLKGLHYDDLFHLYLYITLGNTTWRIEKNEVVTVEIDNRDIKEDCMDINMERRRIKLGDFMKKGEKHQGKDFWSYNSVNNNCQNFAVSLLVGNGLIKTNDQIFKFIKQDSEEVFRRNPKFLAKVGLVFTDLAGIFDLIKEGR